MDSYYNSNVFYLAHGGGPLPLLDANGHEEMINNLKHVANSISKPKRILLISAHWEESVLTITGSNNPSLIYDYYGFPKEAYEVKYPAMGDNKFANNIHELLTQSKISSRIDKNRGFDHGMFIPLKVMYPNADIPCVQLSLKKGLDAKEHINIGRALAPLLKTETLIIGSGFSYHNLRHFFSTSKNASSYIENENFEKWLIETCSNKLISENERSNTLINWRNAPGAKHCHPREEHLIPLHVCYGAAGKACNEYFELTILNKKTSAYLWHF